MSNFLPHFITGINKAEEWSKNPDTNSCWDEGNCQLGSTSKIKLPMFMRHSGKVGGGAAKRSPQTSGYPTLLKLSEKLIKLIDNYGTTCIFEEKQYLVDALRVLPFS